ncbi:MAG: hypothetical protein L0H74_05945 [Brachybacterium sp.]|nr:hypothetical protein [Brachybacterium sp.]
MTTQNVEESWELVGDIASLLDQAAAKVHAASPAYAFDSLGLGILVAQGRLGAQRPPAPPLPQKAPGHQSAVELLKEAEQLSRELPIHRADWAFGVEAAVELCDLIREAQSLGA